MPKTASLEIHQINVGQGDSILIVNRDVVKLRQIAEANGFGTTADGIDALPFLIAKKRVLVQADQDDTIPLQESVRAAVLIDGGDDYYGGNVVDYLEFYGVLDPGVSFAPKLSIVATHYHDDHIAGLRSVLNFGVEIVEPVAVETQPGKKRKTPGVKVSPVLSPRYRPARFYHTLADADNDPETHRLADYRADIVRASVPQTGGASAVHDIRPGGRVGPDGATRCTISLGDGDAGRPIVLRAIAAAQSVDDGTVVTALPSSGSTPDQNDRSIVFVLEYGSFRYFLGGDIAGTGGVHRGNGAHSIGAGAKQAFSTHGDVETAVGRALESVYVPSADEDADKCTVAGHCCGFKADHHASSSSVDTYLLATLQPRVVVITSGVRNHFHNHPTKEVLGRLASARWYTRPADGVDLDATLPTVQIASTIKANYASASQEANPLGGVYANEIAQRHNGKPFLAGVDEQELVGQVKVLGDVVIRPVDEQIGALHGAASTGTATVDIQVYGTADLTNTLDPELTSLRPVDTTSEAPYTVGPFWHSCNKH